MIVPLSRCYRLMQLALAAVVSVVTAVSVSAYAQQQPSGMGAGQAKRAEGTVRYPADVAGQVVADTTFQQFAKPQGWSQDLKQVCDIRRQSLATRASQLRAYLADLRRDLNANAFEEIQAEYGLAEIAAYQGDMVTAVREWEAGLALAKTSIPAGVPQLEEVLGAAYFHKAEMESGIYGSSAEPFLFPPPAGLHLKDAADFTTSAKHLEEYLDHNRAQIDVEWLLNLAYMALGEYPSGVPKKYLLPVKNFESSQSIGEFTDVAADTGLNLVSMAGGIIVDDFDGDGRPDIVTSSYDVCEPLHFFHNNGDGTFSDRTKQAGLSDELGGLNMVQGDYNNDGCMDILVLRGAWEFPVRKSLLRNNCDGTFSDVTAPAGLADPATSTQTAAWADFDNDGRLDLFVGNENAPSQLFRNKGDGTFEDVSHAAGVDRISFAKAVVAADYDRDGYVDFYISNLSGDNFLYHNNHNGTFTDVAKTAGVQNPQHSFASWFFDYDNDGLPDLFVASYSFSLDEALRSYLGLPHTAESVKLYRNLGNGRFEDVTRQVGLDRVFLPMGANFGDVDNDGYLDIYLGNGGPEYGSLFPNTLLRNDGGRRFVDITASARVGDIHKGHGIAFADLQNDGQEDIVANLGGATPGDAHALRVFKNPGNANHWIDIRLVGVKSNRAAIGAEITASVNAADGATRKMFRIVGSGGSFGASPVEQHIGLGDQPQIQRLEIFWPASKTRQVFQNVAADRAIQIKESDHTYTELKRQPIHLGKK